MAKNRNFDEVRVGTVVGFDHVTLHGHEYKCSYAGAVFRDFFPENLTLAKDGWEALGGYIISQPEAKAPGQPTARTDTDRLEWLNIECARARSRWNERSSTIE